MISLDSDIVRMNFEMKNNGAKYGFAHYNIQENVLQLLHERYGNNLNYEEVHTKVKLLNLFYSTNLLATSQMSKHIIGIKEFDRRLREGDTLLVKEIAMLNGRDNYSFATKYCALHKPDLFPIFDSIVASVFVDLFKQGYFRPRYKFSRTNSIDMGEYNASTFYYSILRDYPNYVSFYNYFKNVFKISSSISYREIDFYIWGSCKISQVESQIETLISDDLRKKFNR